MRLFEHRPTRHQIKNINIEHDEQMSFGDRASDGVASYVGSWRFVLTMTSMLVVWIAWNSIPFLPHFDPAPFILLNLCLSFLAGYTAPFILMSQNRQSDKDRLMAEHDYQINLKGEEETRQVYQHLYEQDKELMEQTKMLIKLVKHLIEQKEGLS